MFITNQFDCKRAVYLETIYIEFYNYQFSIIADNEYGTFTIGEYDTPAQVEKVIGMFKAAITSGDKDFTFPTVDELTALPVSRNNLKIEKEARRKTG